MRQTMLVVTLVCFLIFGVKVGKSQTSSVTTNKTVFSKNIDTTNRNNIYCLAKTVSNEARGEPLAGQMAVAHVILNRSKKYSLSICEVTGQTLKGRPQFSRCTNKIVPSKSIVLLALMMLDFPSDFKDNTNGAIYFHALYVQPKWHNVVKTVQIGHHVFYKEY